MKNLMEKLLAEVKKGNDCYLVASIENLPSGVVCPTSIPNFSFNLSRIFSDPFT